MARRCRQDFGGVAGQERCDRQAEAGEGKGFDHSLVHSLLRENEPSYGRNPVPTSPTWKPRTSTPSSPTRRATLTTPSWPRPEPCGSPTNTRRPFRRTSLGRALSAALVRFKTTTSGLGCSTSSTSPGLKGITARCFSSTVGVIRELLASPRHVAPPELGSNSHFVRLVGRVTRWA